MSARAYAVAVVATLLAAASLVLPQHGIVIPGKSFAGLRLGATPAQVEARWGGAHGRCQGCREPTWYFTYQAFAPQGVGVSFRHGRADAFFTLWSPPGWRTREGLAIGAPETEITALYGAMPRAECGTYSALVLRRGRVDTQFYVYRQKVWGFGLSLAGAPPCRS